MNKKKQNEQKEKGRTVKSSLLHLRGFPRPAPVMPVGIGLRRVTSPRLPYSVTAA
jgi:hypothetical protein